MRKGVIITFIILLCLVTGSRNVSAQQIGMFSHSFYKPLIYNPAFAGTDEAGNATIIGRSQWSGFTNSPKLTIFTIDGSLVPQKIGLGLTMISDKKGISNRTGGYLSYSYQLKVKEDIHVMFGVSLGIIGQTLDFSKAVVENNNDQTLFADPQHKTTLDGNAGFVLVWKDLEFGAAAPQIFGNKINYVDASNVREYYTQARHIMSSLKYRYVIVKEKGIAIVPQATVRYVANTPFQFDGTVNLNWNSKFWVGATYKSSYAVAANAGYCYKQFSVGYSYDIVIGNIGKYSGMSHEIMINYRFGKSKKSDVVTDSVAKTVTPVVQNPVTTPVTKPTEQVAETKAEKDARLLAETANAEKKNALLAKVNESEAKIKELKEKIQIASEKTPTMLPPLNSVLIQQLQKQLEALLDNPKTTPAQIQELRNDIAAFLDTDGGATANTKLEKGFETLVKPPAEDAPSVLVRGRVIFEGSTELNNYSIVSITITDKDSKQLVGIYTPNAKTGQYLFILAPGQSYLIVAKTKGYQLYSQDFAPAFKAESYEMTQEIRLKKE